MKLKRQPSPVFNVDPVNVLRLLVFMLVALAVLSLADVAAVAVFNQSLNPSLSAIADNTDSK